jgi:serine/alanine adding enzyme
MAGFFNSGTFYKICLDSDYFNPYKVNVSDEHVIGLTAGSYFSRRSLFYNPPIGIEFSENLIEDFLFKSKDIFSNSVYIELRNIDNQQIDDELLRKHGFLREDWLNIFIDLKKKSAFELLSDSKKRQVKNSIANGAVFLEAKSEKELQQFYSIIKNLYKNKIGKPLPDWNFFLSFFRYSKLNPQVKVFVVKKEDEVIGGMLCPFSEGKIVYEFLVAGLDNEMKGTGIYPSVFLTFKAVEFAQLNGFEVFNFMGAGYPNKPYGVRDFKKQFGGEMVNAGRYYKVQKRIFYYSGKAYINVKSKYQKYYNM